MFVMNVFVKLRKLYLNTYIHIFSHAMNHFFTIFSRVLVTKIQKKSLGTKMTELDKNGMRNLLDF